MFNKRIFLLITILVFLSSKGFCEEPTRTYKDETIFENTTWSGKVLIDGVVTVFTEITLTIEPGTTIMFKKVDTNSDGLGESELYIQGELIAQGTKENPILFTSAEVEKKPGDWVAVNMMLSETGKNIIANCILEYAYRGFHAHYSTMNLIDCEMKNNFLAVQFQESTVTIKNCNIHDNNQGMQMRDSKLKMEKTKITYNNIGIRCANGDADLTKNSVYGSNTAAFQIRGSTINIDDINIGNNMMGITAQDSTVNITNSTILNNMEDGISLHNSKVEITKSIIFLNADDGIYLENTTAVINNNNIFNNAKYNINLEQAEGVDARYNYWGSEFISRVDYFNYDKKDNSSLGELNVDGYLKSEIRLINEWTKKMSPH